MKSQKSEFASTVVLIGGGTSNALAKRLCDLCGKKPHVLIFPTARRDEEDFISEVCECFEPYAKKLDVIKLTKEKIPCEQIRDKMLSCDLIYVPGGSNEALMYYWERYGIDKYLREASLRENLVLAGSSAGGIYFSRAGFNDYEDGSYHFIDGLGIVPVWFGPHYQSDVWKGFDSELSDKREPALAFTASNDAGILCSPDGKFYTFFGAESNRIWRFVYDKQTESWKKTSYSPLDSDDMYNLTDITPC